MKQKDIIVLLVVGFITGVASFFLSQAIFSTNKLDQKVEKVDKISAEFPEADKTVFNKDAVNPTQLIQIGDGTNTKLF